MNVAKAMAKSLGIKDAHKIELLYETIRKEIEKEKGNVKSDGENAAGVHDEAKNDGENAAVVHGKKKTKKGKEQ